MLSFENDAHRRRHAGYFDAHRRRHAGYFLPIAEIKNYNVLIF